MVNIYNMVSNSLICQPNHSDGTAGTPELKAETALTPALLLCEVTTHIPIKTEHMPVDLTGISIAEFLQRQLPPAR